MTEIYALDPEMILHSHFHFKSFPCHAKHRESERKNAKNNTGRAQPKKMQNTERARERTRAPIQPTSERNNESSDPANEREKERELRSSHRHRSTSHRSRRAQPDDHRAKCQTIVIAKHRTAPIAKHRTVPSRLSLFLLLSI